jgi:opacity protein-like surface antigen
VEIPSKLTLQGTGLFTTNRNADGTTQDATNSGGFLVGYAHQFNGWAGLETNYGYSRNTQNYFSIADSTGIQSNTHQFTGAFVANLPANTAWFRPYALAGGGALLFDPTGKATVAGADRQAKAAFLYGGGVEFDVTPYVGLRGEYRGFVYEPPDFDIQSLNLDRFTHLTQPSFGIYFRF